MKQDYLMLLWHMHQPYYKDLVLGQYAMPWVRLHALKDYYGMVAILREFPTVHVTFNLVPSLVAQLVEYADDQAQEPALELAFEPVEKMGKEDKEDLLEFAFHLNHEHLMGRYSRFRELFEKVESTGHATAARILSPQETLDLQVLSQLAWFDEIYLSSDTEIGALVEKGRGFTEADKSLLRRKEIELSNKVLEQYREAAESGRIEISTSPFYHPILPLLCDTGVAEESHPGVTLPRRNFRHPEDARDQLRAAAEFHERCFGRRPRGLWPSEGSVSDEALTLAAEEGFTWAATDEGVLARTLGRDFSRRGDGTTVNGEELYRPHRFVSGDRRIALFFRDHQLSDLIGFVYSRMDPEAAAADLHQRIRTAARSTGERPAIVSVILDGENAWEFYPGNGRQFLKNFYERVAADPGLRAVTASEAADLAEPGEFQHIVPGSWINSNFDIWIGADEDNRAWDLLNDARDYFASNSTKPGLTAEQVKLAREELWIAEGSDWCWWYGPEHSSEQDEQFDQLYRKHLSNIYHALGGSPPDDLAVPIKRPRARVVNVSPTGPIEPRVDGQVTSYFEWLGAGLYAPDLRAGSMHGAAEYFEALYYGTNRQSLFLRLDLSAAFLKEHRRFEIRVSIDGEGRARVQAGIAEGGISQTSFWKGGDPVELKPAPNAALDLAFKRVFELRLDHALVGLSPGARARLQVSIWVDELPVQIIPSEGWLTLELTDAPAGW